MCAGVVLKMLAVSVETIEQELWTTKVTPAIYIYI